MTLPLSPRMSYGQMRMALYDVAPDLHVASAWLPGKLDGIYCLATNTVLIDRRITYTRKRCALVHELVHWQHGDDTSNGCRGGKLEQRCRHETTSSCRGISPDTTRSVRMIPFGVLRTLRSRM